MKIFKTLWFKCIACLLIIAVISGALLSALSNLWLVSPAMRTARAISKIYGEEKEYSVKLDIDTVDEKDKADGKDKAIEYDIGTINKIYEIGTDMLFQATGYKGYKNGTITLWVRVAQSGEKYEIEKVLLETFEKQTLMSKLTDDFYGKFNLTDITESYKDGKTFDAKEHTEKTLYNPVSGATFSATAAANAVNCVIRYIGDNLGGEA